MKQYKAMESIKRLKIALLCHYYDKANHIIPYKPHKCEFAHQRCNLNKQMIWYSSNIAYNHQSKRLWAASIHTSEPYTKQYSLDALHDHEQITKRYDDSRSILIGPFARMLHSTRLVAMIFWYGKDWRLLVLITGVKVPQWRLSFPWLHLNWVGRPHVGGGIRSWRT